MGTDKKPLIIGQQMAKARAQEAARLAAGGAGASPIPEGGYDHDHGEHSLLVVEPLPIDDALRKLTRDFRCWETEQRLEARRAMSMDDQYTLIHFAKRCAVFALGEDSVEPCADGLTALAMIDEARIDPRDAAWATGLLSYAAAEIGADREQLAEQAGALATAGMKSIINRVTRSSKLSEWGYAVARVGESVGLIQSDGAPYGPTLDLGGLALKIAGEVQQGKYVAEAEIEAGVPVRYWFMTERQGEAEKALERTLAAVIVRGDLRKGHHDEPDSQMFMQWIMEMPGDTEAAALAGYVGDCPQSGRFTVGVCAGPLFALLVAGSTWAEEEPLESQETLTELAEQTRALMVKAVAG